MARSVQIAQIREAEEQNAMTGCRCPKCALYSKFKIKHGDKGPWKCPRCGADLPLQAKEASRAGRPAVGFKRVVP
jgi:transposase-like protein